MTQRPLVSHLAPSPHAPDFPSHGFPNVVEARSVARTELHCSMALPEAPDVDVSNGDLRHADFLKNHTDTLVRIAPLVRIHSPVRTHRSRRTTSDSRVRYVEHKSHLLRSGHFLQHPPPSPHRHLRFQVPIVVLVFLRDVRLCRLQVVSFRKSSAFLSFLPRAASPMKTRHTLK